MFYLHMQYLEITLSNRYTIYLSKKSIVQTQKEKKL